MTGPDQTSQQHVRPERATESESEAESQSAAPAPETDTDGEEPIERPDGSAETGDEPALDSFVVVVDGESVTIDAETTAAELGQSVDADPDTVFTYRTSDGVKALSGDQTVANAIDDGAELRTQPLGDGEVFG